MNVSSHGISKMLFCYSNKEEKIEVVNLLKKHFYYTYYLNKIELNKVNEELYKFRRDWERRFYLKDKTLKIALLALYGSLNDFNNIIWKVKDCKYKNEHIKQIAFNKIFIE